MSAIDVRPVDVAGDDERGSARRIGRLLIALRGWPMLRVLNALGPQRILRLAVVWLYVMFLVQVVAGPRPDLRDPTRIGSDPSNYLAAGQRLGAGEPLYHLSPGDRPVQADAPPYYEGVPLLSPPAVALAWAPLAALPSWLSITAWWVGGLAIAVIFGAAVILSAPIGLVAVAVVLIPSLAITAWSGNVNAWLLALESAAWIACGRRTRTGDVVTGLSIGIAAALKLTPIYFVAWLLAGRRWRASAISITAVSAIAAAAAIPNLGNYVSYLDVARATTAAGATPLSLPGFLRSVGFSGSWLDVVPLITSLVLVVAAIAAGRRSRISFALSVIASVVGSPVLRVESFSLVLVAAVPWMRLDNIRWPKFPIPRGVLVAATAAAVVLAGLATETRPVPSRLAIDNRTDQDVIVRFAPGNPASFGYEVGAGAHGLAWDLDAGAFTGRLEVFTPECRLLDSFDLSGSGGLLDVGPGGIAVSPSAGAGPEEPALQYDTRCSANVYTQ